MQRSLSKSAIALTLAAGLAAPIVFTAPDAFANAHLKRAKGFAEVGELREATIELKNALRAEPNNAEARLLLGKLTFATGDMKGAVQDLRRATEIAPNDEAEVLLGEIALRQGNPKKALKEVARPADSEEMQIQKSVIAGGAHLALRQTDEAKENYEKVLKLDKSRIEAHFGLARVARAQENFVEARELVEKIVSSRPDYGPAWMLRGDIALTRDNYITAEQSFTRAIELSPNNFNGLVARARARLAAGNLESARADAKALKRQIGNAPIAHYIQAAVAFAEGDVEEANHSFFQFQKEFDDFPPAILLGALIKTKRGELGQAQSMLQRYLSTKPDNLDASRALAAVRLRRGKAKGAQDVLRDILARAPGDTEALRLMASAHLSLGEIEAAQRSYEKITQVAQGRDASFAQTALAMLDPDATLKDPELSNIAVRVEVLRATEGLERGDLETVADAVDELTKLAPASASTAALKAALAAAKGDESDARQLINSALDRNPELIAALGAADALDRSAGEPEATIDRLQKLLSRKPESEILTLRFANALTGNGRANEALQMLLAQTKRLPGSAPISRALVSTALRVDQEKLAVREAQRLAAMPDISAASLLVAAQAFTRSGDSAMAVKVTGKLRQVTPDSVGAFLLHARALSAAGGYEDAKHVLATASDRWPSDQAVADTKIDLAVQHKDDIAVRTATDRLARSNPVHAALLQARFLNRSNKPKEAIKVLERAHQRTPDSKVAVELFRSRLDADKDEQAFKGIRAWLKENPEDRGALLALATAQMTNKSYRNAEDTYAKFLAIEPRNPIALNNYALLRHKEQRSDAIDYARRAYTIAGENPAVADTYGWLLVEIGQASEALPILARAAKDAKDNPEIGYHYAFALMEAGRRTDARNQLAYVLDTTEAFDQREQAEELFATLR